MPSVIEQIVERTGLSKVTVSHVLGKRAHLFRPETRDKVYSVARELGYRPNAAARATRTGRFGAVGLLTSSRGHEAFLPFSVLFGIQQESVANDLHVTFGNVPDEKLTDPRKLPKILREWSVDGLLISYTSHQPRPMLDLIEQHAIPSIWLNARFGHDCIHPDDLGAGRSATEHLIRLGHRRIAFAGSTGTADHYSYTDRFQGYAAAMREAGLQVIDLRRTFARDEPSRPYHESLIQQPDRPTAFVMYGVASAEGLMCAAWRAGLVVPRDLSVVAIEPERQSHTGYPPTTLHWPEGALGREAVRMLIQKMKNPTEPLPARSVPYELHPGETCAPPGADPRT